MSIYPEKKTQFFFTLIFLIILYIYVVFVTALVPVFPFIILSSVRITPSVRRVRPFAPINAVRAHADYYYDFFFLFTHTQEKKVYFHVIYLTLHNMVTVSLESVR